MMYFLGIITGITLCIFIALLNKKLENKIERVIKQTQSKLKEKGAIIEPQSDELQDWIDNLKTE